LWCRVLWQRVSHLMWLRRRPAAPAAKRYDPVPPSRACPQRALSNSDFLLLPRSISQCCGQPSDTRTLAAKN
jgi:hypothetical protein